MNRFFCIIIVLTFLSSCQRDDDQITINNSQDIENYCIENGWSEVNINTNSDLNSLYYFFGHYACIWDEDQNCLLAYRGNSSFENCNYSLQEMKQYSNFNDMVNVNTPPTDGFIDVFSVENEKFIIQHNYFADDPIDASASIYDGYVKIYLKKINAETIKIYYKGCSW